MSDMEDTALCIAHSAGSRHFLVEIYISLTRERVSLAHCGH